MKDKKINLNDIKSEIESRKKTAHDEMLKTGAKPIAKNTFLYELQQSLHSGVMNEAAQIVKGVAKISENKTVDGSGMVSNKNNISTNDILKNIPIKQKPQNQPQNFEMSKERDVGLFAEVEKRTKEYNSQGANITNSYINENVGQPQSIMLNENSKQFLISVIDDYMKENFVGIVQEIMKNSIIDMYSSKKIEETIFDNEKVVKDLFYKFLKELKNKQDTK